MIVTTTTNDAILNDCANLLDIARDLEDLSADPYVVLAIRRFVRVALSEM